MRFREPASKRAIACSGLRPRACLQPNSFQAALQSGDEPDVRTPMNRDSPPATRHAFAGSIALFLGIGLLLLILLDVACDLPWSMPPSWYEHRTLWGVLGLTFGAAGWILQRGPNTRDPR